MAVLALVGSANPTLVAGDVVLDKYRGEPRALRGLRQQTIARADHGWCDAQVHCLFLASEVPREESSRIHGQVADGDVERLLKGTAQIHLAEVLLDLLLGERICHGDEFRFFCSTLTV